MAFYPNLQYGLVPGAPQGTHRWIGNQFVMSDLPPVPVPLPAVVPPPPPSPITPADVVQRAVNPTGTQPGGAEPGGGGPGTGPGGVGGGGQDTTTSGYPGVYAQAPGELNSQFGNMLGTAGMGVPYPGAGTALGALGGFIDASRYNGINAQNGLPATVNPWGSAAHEILSGIGVPFTDWDLASLFDVPSARQRHEDILRANLAAVGPTTLNSSMPGAAAVQSYGALQANEPHQPGAPFGNTGWAAGMDPTASQYPAGFDQFTGAATLAGISPETAGALSKEAAQIIGANPDIFGQGGGNAAADSKGDIALGGDVSGTSGLADGAGYKFRGGLIGRPPGQAGDDITRGQFGLLRGIDPPGPDDQIAAVQSGEGVLTRKALARYPGLLDAANAGKIAPKKLAGLLAVVPVKARRR